MSVHSKFLFHWIGQDLVEEETKKLITPDALAKEYARRLKDDYQNGLFTIRKKEPKVLPKVSIDHLVRICFTEIRLGQAKTHADRYGKLGIGFTRDFVVKKGGRRVIYVPWESDSGLLEESIKSVWKKSKGNEEIHKPAKWLFAFCKPMSNAEAEDSKEYINYYEEMEWRMVYGEGSDRSGAFTNPKRYEHRVRFDPADVKVIVFPDERVKQRILDDADMKKFFSKHQPNLVTLEDCPHF